VSQVNLLPKEILERQTIRRNTAVIVLVGAFLLLGVVGLYLLEGSQLSTVNDQIAAQQAENATVQAQIGKLQPFADLQTQAQQQQALLDSAWSGEVSFSGILMDISRVIPAEMDLSSLNVTLTAPVAGATTTPTTTNTTTFVGTINMAGNALNPETIASWLTRLGSVKGWANPWASNATLSTDGGPYSLTTTVDLTTDVVTPRGSRGGTTSGG
jgi:Tfp pilus assembly protein PilN